MNGYIIRTANNDIYKTDTNGYVLEYSIELKKDRDDENRKIWQLTGAWYNTGFGNTRNIPLSILLENDDNLILTNGKPRFGLVDIDHGTKRLHGNKEYHGIISISTY